MNAELSNSDRRHYPRYAVEACIEFVTLTGATEGRTSNVSRGGVAADVDRPLPPGLVLNIRMSLVFDEDSISEPLVLPARLVWCTPVGDSFQLGAAFTNLSDEQETYLAMFLRYLDAHGSEERDIENTPAWVRDSAHGVGPDSPD